MQNIYNARGSDVTTSLCLIIVVLAGFQFHMTKQQSERLLPSITQFQSDNCLSVVCFNTLETLPEFIWGKFIKFSMHNELCDYFRNGHFDQDSRKALLNKLNEQYACIMKNVDYETTGLIGDYTMNRLVRNLLAQRCLRIISISSKTFKRYAEYKKVLLITFL